MIKSIFSNWMTLTISALTSIVMTPVLVHRLGQTQYGMWVLTGSLIDYYALLDMGMRAGLFRFAARFKGVDSRAELDRTFASAFSVALGASIALICSLPVLIVVLPHFLKLNGSLVHTFRLVVLFMGLAMAVTLTARMLSTYVASLSRFDLSNLADSTTIVVRSVAIYAILKLGHGIVAVGVVMLLGSIFYLIFAYTNVRRADPGSHLALVHAQWRRIRDLASFSMYVSLGSLGDYLRFYTDSIVITRMISVALVTPFSIPVKFLAYMQAIIIGFGAPINAELNSLDAQQRRYELQTLYMRSTRMAAVITLFMTLLLAMNGKAILTLWIRQDMTLSYRVFLVLLIGYVAELSQHPSILILLARGRQKMLGSLTLAEGAANLLLSILWARRFGILGVAWGTVIPMLVIRTLVIPTIAIRATGVSIRTYFVQAVARPFAVAIAAVLALLPAYLHGLNVFSVRHLLIGAVWQFCALGVAFYFFALIKDDRQYLKRVLNSVTARLIAR